MMLPALLLLAPLLTAEPVPASTPAPKPELTLDALFAESSAKHTPVVLDVFTTWCKPCKDLEATVLSRPEVKKALAAYRFEHVDAEGVNAAALVDRFHAVGYPDVIVLTPEGKVVEHILAQTPAPFIAGLHALLPLARTRGPFTREESDRRPRDAGLAYITGLDALLKGDPSNADELFERAEKADAHNALHIANRAALQRLAMIGPEVPAPERARRLLVVATRDPSSPQALKALEGVTALVHKGTPAPAGFVEALDACAKVQRDPDALSSLIYAQLILKDTSRALALANALEVASQAPEMQDTVAEAHYQAGQKEDAVKREQALVTANPKNKTLAANLARFQGGKPGLPSDAGPDDFWTGFQMGRATALMPGARTAVLLAVEGKKLVAACGSALGEKNFPVKVQLDAGKVQKLSAKDPAKPPPGLACLVAQAPGKVSMPADVSGEYELYVRVPHPAK